MGRILRSDTLTTVIIVGGAALLLYILYKRSSLGRQWTTAETATALQQAGLKTYKTDLGTFAQTGSTTYKLDPAAALTSATSPNLAQKILIGIDGVIPGTWLTRKVLG